MYVVTYLGQLNTVAHNIHQHAWKYCATGVASFPKVVWAYIIYHNQCSVMENSSWKRFALMCANNYLPFLRQLSVAVTNLLVSHFPPA